MARCPQRANFFRGNMKQWNFGLTYFPLFAGMVEVVLRSANVRVNEVRLLSLGALRHHSSDCLRQRPSVGGYSSQFARTLLRLCFAKLLVLLVGGPDDATACAPYGARPVASGNLTTSSQVHLALTQPDACGAGESLGDVEIGSSGGVKLLNSQSPKLQETKATKLN